MSTEFVPIPVEYNIRTTSDWTKFQIVEGGLWSKWDVDCLKGCDKLTQGIGVDDKTITIAKAPDDTTLVEARVRCTLNINKKYLDSDISYLITKGDRRSTTVKIIVQGKKIIPEKTNLYNIQGDPYNPMAFKVSTSRHVSAYEKANVQDLIGVTPSEYGELENRAKKCLRFEKIGNFVNSMYMLFVVVPFMLYSVFLAKPIMGREQIEWWEFFVWMVIGGVIAVFSIRWVRKKARKYKLEDDEWAKYYTYSMVDNLKNYFKAKTTGLKRDHRKKTVKLAKDFLSCIKKRWKIGTFKLAQDYFGKSLSELKKNIDYRVIPTLKGKSDKSLKNVEQIMVNFLAESRSLDLEGIKRINKQMSSKLDKTEYITFSSRLSNFFSAHKILKHVLFVSTVIVGCCVFYFMILNYVGISKEYVFVATITLLAAMLTIYFTRQPKEQP